MHYCLFHAVTHHYCTSNTRVSPATSLTCVPRSRPRSKDATEVCPAGSQTRRLDIGASLCDGLDVLSICEAEPIISVTVTDRRAVTSHLLMCLTARLLPQ